MKISETEKQLNRLTENFFELLYTLNQHHKTLMDTANEIQKRLGKGASFHLERIDAPQHVCLRVHYNGDEIVVIDLYETDESDDLFLTLSRAETLLKADAPLAAIQAFYNGLSPQKERAVL